MTECLASVAGEAIVVSAGNYELGKLDWIVQNTTLERFLFLQDSVIVQPSLYSLLDEFTGSVALLSDPDVFGSYIGVYERDVLIRVGIPSIQSKLEAVQAERSWTKKYVEAAGEVPVLFPEVTDRNADRVLIRHGRENLILENEHFTKFKGTWRNDQISNEI